MPARVGRKKLPPRKRRSEEKEEKKEDKSLWGRVKGATRSEYSPVNIGVKTGKGFYNIGTGLPAGAVAFGKIAGQRSTKRKYGIPVPTKDQNKFLKAVAKSTATDLRHPLRDPASTILTAGGLAAALFSGGASLGVKGGATIATTRATGSVAKGAKAGLKTKRSKVRTRTFEGLPEADPKSGKGKDFSMRLAREPKIYKVEATKNPIGMGVRAALDQAYKGSRNRAIAGKPSLVLRKKEGGYARGRIKKTDAEEARRTKQQKGELHPEPELSGKQEAARATTNLVRLAMLAKPKYYAQNIFGTAGMLAAGGGSTKAVRATRQMKKKDPELYAEVQKGAGAGGIHSMGIESGVGKSKKSLSSITNKAMEKANIPESHMRPVAFVKAAMDEGIDSPAALKKVMADPSSQKYQRIAKRANERVVDYGRLGPTEMKFISSQIPIFYAMTKGFTRYTGRFPSEYPVKAGIAAQIGKEGKKRQKAHFGNLPWYAPYLIPAGKKGARNPGPFYQFQPGIDAARQAAETFKGNPQAGITLLQSLNPTPELLFGAATGLDPATGWELKDLKSRGRLLAALGETGRRLAGPTAAKALGFDRETKTYEPISLLRTLALELAGTGAVKRNLKDSTQAEWKPGDGKRRRRKRLPRR